MSFTLVIGNRLIAQTVEAARRALPEECCGLLLGCETGDTHHVRQIVESPNLTADDATRRYLVDPQLVFEALWQARHGGPELIGVFHSHPTGSAVPSKRDREVAWPDLSYLIVPGDAEAHPEPRCWRWPGPGHRFTEVQIKTSAHDDVS